MMRSNIDLTEGEIFSHPPSNNFSRRNLFTSLLKVDKNTVVIPEYLLHIGDNMNELIYTGDRECRKLKKEYEKLQSTDYCDCCGKFLKKFPWDKAQCLCWECLEKLETSHEDRFPLD